MNKKEIEDILAEAHEAHTSYSHRNGGHWKKQWRNEVPDLDAINGYWYWKGHRLTDLADQLSKLVNAE